MIGVTTGSRLHFGLFRLPGAEAERLPNHHGEPALPARRFGGVGLMIEAPGVQLSVTPEPTWSAEGPLAGRALACARRFATESTQPCRISVVRCAPEHAGLGTGTQLGLAVARALAEMAGELAADPIRLAQRMGRGARSALGIHGFAHSGFLMEAGQQTPGEIGPLVVRHSFPEDWRIVLILPPWKPGLHGELELQAFARLAPPPPGWTDALCRIALLGMLPALVERDWRTFGEAVYDFNSRVGEAFTPVQGGTYADPRIADLVRFVRARGVPGVGQSSWGPAVFAIVEDQSRGEELARQVSRAFALQPSDVLVTPARNRGAEVFRTDAA